LIILIIISNQHYNKNNNNNNNVFKDWYAFVTIQTQRKCEKEREKRMKEWGKYDGGSVICMLPLATPFHHRDPTGTFRQGTPTYYLY
jgi:chloramphenicol O-acetyltransferase